MIMAVRRLDFCSLQVTGWKGGCNNLLPIKIGGYQFFLMGFEMGVQGVGGRTA